jgi:hypothetical protein
MPETQRTQFAFGRGATFLRNEAIFALKGWRLMSNCVFDVTVVRQKPDAPTNSGGMDVGHTNPTRQRGECRRNPRWRVGLVWPAIREVDSEVFTREVS